ncbi:uncharacterized protein [Physcomitrium patens]|uniref:V-type proton ATPase subunit S1/VOA1 transmembrane domain-containing protein n=1 Tax=Physcomitrium patens TaxID=3218 RepID=A9RPZ5_PHYPA|nr:uncharacterized protein LOC112294941 isoform X1 [Physcomitrium patens]PNR62801.1 hypothetical protein PHYPA_001225 [Physcomitrium patens]|eukprot:XP_024401764.1 uncharacterized protein LOC112294941 isoform X1 [Physcomitrella patens]
MGRRQGMQIGVVGFFMLGLASLLLVVSQEFPVESSSSTVTPAFIWSDLRCLFAQDRRVNYEFQTSETLVDTIFHDFGRCAATEDEVQEEAKPEMIIMFIGKELRSEDISRSASSSVLKTLQKSITGVKYSMSIPYVTSASDKASISESFLSNIRNKFDTTPKIGVVAVSGSCATGDHAVKRLADVADIQGYIFGRKTSRAQGETDVMVICYSPTLHWSTDGVSNSEGIVLEEVLSTVKSSGTSNVAIYFSEPSVSSVKHHGILERHLLEGSGTGSTDCDALCRSRAVILEGIFVAFTLITILVSGICCMKAVKSPARFETAKES